MRDTEASRHTTLCAMINHETQVSGLAIRPKEEWPKTLREGVENLRYLCGGEDDFRRHEPFGVLNDSDLLRFLLARGGNVPKAVEMLREVLRWRTRRMPYFLLVDPNSDVAQCFATEARTGKIIVAGPDKFGRGVVLMDPTVENTLSEDNHMRFMAYNLQAARDMCATGVDKIVMVANAEQFTLNNAICMTGTKDTLKEIVVMLTMGFAETVGTCILWQPPRAFQMTWMALKRFFDARTLEKIVFVKGACDPGTENDHIMNELVGHNWREVTRLTEPRSDRAHSAFHGREIPCARGFDFSAYWPQVVARDKERARAKGCPPWPFTWRKILDTDCWDGAFWGFWQANLKRADTEGSDSDEGYDTADEFEEKPLRPPQANILGKPVVLEIGQPAVCVPPQKRPQRCTVVSCIGVVALVLNGALVVKEWTSSLPPDEFHVLALLDIPLVSCGLGLLMGTGATGHCGPFLRWVLLILGVLLTIEPLGETMGAVSLQGDSFWSGYLEPLMELINAVLTITFALLWIRDGASF